MRTSSVRPQPTRQLKPSELDVLRQSVDDSAEESEDEQLRFARGVIVGCIASAFFWAALAGLIFILL